MTKVDLKETVKKKAIGKRFKQFREFIKKSLAELSEELKITKGIISSIETGKILPGFPARDYLNNRYHLNIDWLIHGSGEMIHSQVINTKHPELHQLVFQIDENDPMYENYMELFSLLRVPDVEMLIFAKLAEIKLFAKNEIASFFQET